jgi:hypothetical protein
MIGEIARQPWREAHYLTSMIEEIKVERKKMRYVNLCSDVCKITILVERAEWASINN